MQNTPCNQNGFFLSYIALSLCFSKHLHLSLSLPNAFKCALLVLLLYICCLFFRCCLWQVLSASFSKDGFLHQGHSNPHHVHTFSLVHSGLANHDPLGPTISTSSSPWHHTGSSRFQQKHFKRVPLHLPQPIIKYSNPSPDGWGSRIV